MSDWVGVCDKIAMVLKEAYDKPLYYARFENS